MLNTLAKFLDNQIKTRKSITLTRECADRQTDENGIQPNLWKFEKNKIYGLLVNSLVINVLFVYTVEIKYILDA